MRELAAVIVGAIVGTGLRFGFDTVIPHTDDQFPLSTLLINVVGSFALGFLVARVWPTAAPWLKAGLGPGLLGSFTTFSAVAVSFVALSTHDRLWLAAVYLVVSVTLGFLGALAGIRLGGGRAPRIDAVNE